MKRLLHAIAASVSLLVSPALAQASPSAARPQDDALAPTGRWSANTAGRALTPPMGWNSWNAFALDIDESKLLASAMVIKSSGLADKGYQYINIDEGWWARRAADGRLVVRTDKFPSAKGRGGKTSFRPLTDRLHALGFRAGIYSDIGRNSCGQLYSDDKPNLPSGTVAEREVGLYGHVDQDVALYFREWGFDYIKVDGCGIRGLPADAPKVLDGTFRALTPLIDSDVVSRTNIAAVRDLYQQVARALATSNPDGDYVLSICLWGSSNVRAWAKDVGNVSRTSEDIFPTWSRMLHNLDSVARRPLYAHPGSWNDPDMLYIGMGDFDASHMVEARSHMSLWAMLNAPLLIGMDLRKATAEQLAIFGQPELIALNQDPAGNQAVLAHDSDDLMIFVKTLATGRKAVAILNRLGAPVDMTLTAEHMKFSDDRPVTLRDLWTGAQSSFAKETGIKLAPHETRIFMADGTRRLPDGLYLSEMPGRINPAVDGVVHPEDEPLIHRGILPWRNTRGGGERPRYAGWGGAQIDMTPFGGTLSVAGRRYVTGMGVLANSRLEIRNDGSRSFAAMVGVDDSAEDSEATVTVAIFADGRLVSRSAPMRRGEPPALLTAGVADARIIEIVTRMDRPVGGRMPVDLLDAAFTR